VGEKTPVLEFRIEVIIEPDGTSFHAYCPAFKGLHTCGDTKEEALQNAKDAALAYLESLIKHGDPIPVGVVIQREAKETKSAARYTENLRVACAI
jgi:predicted RNase H-like HicB family nuclease